jgi:hypothetical protein
MRLHRQHSTKNKDQQTTAFDRLVMRAIPCDTGSSRRSFCCCTSRSSSELEFWFFISIWLSKDTNSSCPFFPLPPAFGEPVTVSLLTIMPLVRCSQLSDPMESEVLIESGQDEHCCKTTAMQLQTFLGYAVDCRLQTNSILYTRCS